MMHRNKINIINRFLFFCAGVQNNLIVNCPTTEYLKYASIGASVFFTTILALVSSYFAFSLVFDEWWVSVLFAVLWMAIIFNLDRFLVSGIRKNQGGLKMLMQYLPRIFLAFFIAMVVSKPIELKLFEQEIDKQLTVMQLEELNLIESRFNPALAAIDKQIEQLQTQIENKFQLKEGYYLDYKCECDGTCGTGVRGVGSECERKRRKYESFNAEYQDFKADAEAKIEGYGLERNRLVNQKDADRLAIKNVYADGLLARLDALSQLPGNYSAAIMLIFVLVEIGPIITKMMSSKGPYEMLIQEKEYQYSLDYKEKIHSQNQEHLKNKKIIELEKEIHLKQAEERLHEKKKNNIMEKHEALRMELKKKLNPRNES